MNFQDIYRKFSYKAQLKITKNPEKLRDIIQDQLPFLIENYRKDELSEIENFLIDNRGFSVLNDLRHDFYEKIIVHAINNDNVEMFKEYKGGMVEIRKNLVPLLIDKNNLELVKIFCNSPFGCDSLYEQLEDRLYNAADEKNYEALNKIFKFEEDFKKYVQSLPAPKHDPALSSMENFQNITGYDTVSNFVKSSKNYLGTDLLNHALHKKSKEILDYTTNLGRFQVKSYIVSNLVEHNEVEFLKTVLTHPNINIDHLKSSIQTSIHPEAMLLAASRTGAVDVMKFAVEFNNAPLPSKILEDSLKFSVMKGSKEGVGYLLTEFKAHYNKDLLNEIAQVLVDQKKYDMVTYMKEKHSLVEVEVPITQSPYERTNNLDNKINRLRENAINSNESKNTLSIG